MSSVQPDYPLGQTPADFNTAHAAQSLKAFNNSVERFRAGTYPGLVAYAVRPDAGDLGGRYKVYIDKLE
ncbi:hypothetical protein H0H93_009320, partial [Arthromyces matolae]